MCNAYRRFINHSKHTNQNMVNDKICFVISPIGKEGSDIRKRSDLTFNYIIKPIVQEFGYKPLRADHINESGMITNQIISYIINSSLVIADLTDSNPNVFYELAVRHFAKKPCIQMMKSNQQIPFDIAGMRIIRFDIDLEHAESAKKVLSEQIKSIKNNNFKAINPVILATNDSTAQEMIRTPEPGDIIKVVPERVKSHPPKKPKINLSQLVQYGKIKEGDKLFFYDRIRRKRYEDEYAFVAGDKLRYWRDNRFCSPTQLAKKLRTKVHLTDADQATQGPIFWITENGRILDDLNNEVREILYGDDNAI